MIALRAPQIDDADAVLEVLSARDTADTGAPDFTLQDVLDEWRAPDVELSEDARVAERDGRIVGYGIVRRSYALVAVDPRFEGHGAGRALLEWAQRQNRRRGRVRDRQWIAATNIRARELLTDAGYAHVRSYWRMVRELSGRDRPGPPPEGIRLRALDLPADAVAVHALDDVSFSAVPDYNPSSFDEFREDHLEAHDLDPGLSVIAEADHGRMAGILLARVWPEQSAGFVDLLAVHPEHQGRGLGSALLRHGFAGFAAAGLREAQLMVASDNPRPLRLYERVGMRQKFRFDDYQRDSR